MQRKKKKKKKKKKNKKKKKKKKRRRSLALTSIHNYTFVYVGLRYYVHLGGNPRSAFCDRIS